MSVAIIPARMSSTRLPGKMLAEIDGLPLVVHVLRQVELAAEVTRVLVATGDSQIAEVVRHHGGEVIRTQAEHLTGSDRVAEAVSLMSEQPEYILNVQGDNLHIDPDTIDSVVRRLRQGGAGLVTAVTPLPPDIDPAEPSKVKAVVTPSGRVVYFSRSAVPAGGPWWLHLGVYGFSRDLLLQFAAWPQGSLEKSEGLEQLRLLERGIEIHTVQVFRDSCSIDTAKDLAQARSTPFSTPRQ